MYSGACSHRRCMCSGYSEAKAARPTPASTPAAGLRPVTSRNALAPREPKINACFQCFMDGLLVVRAAPPEVCCLQIVKRKRHGLARMNTDQNQARDDP